MYPAGTYLPGLAGAQLAVKTRRPFMKGRSRHNGSSDRVVWSEQGSSHQRVGTTGSHVQFWRRSLGDHGPAAA